MVQGEKETPRTKNDETLARVVKPNAKEEATGCEQKRHPEHSRYKLNHTQRIKEAGKEKRSQSMTERLT